MKFKTKNIDITSMAFKNVVLLNKKDTDKLGIKAHDRLLLKHKDKEISAIVDVTQTFLEPGFIGLYKNVYDKLDVPENTEITVSLTKAPDSITYIQEKMASKLPYTKKQINSILRDIYDRNLSAIEIAVYLMTQEYIPLSSEEIEYLTRGMAELGQILDWDETIYTKHSIGGVPGNKVSLLIVPIVASTGLLIPKISTRAITSPAGTADTMEIFSDIEFNAEEIKEMALKTCGTICWGGKLDLSPADSIISSVESMLNLDPDSQIIASILSKQLALGVNKMVLDLPQGLYTKVKTIKDARKFSHRFIEIADRIGIRLECGITYGGQPVGYNIGPALEAREALETLMGHGPNSLIEKSVELAGILLELGCKAERGNGYRVAEKILKTGKALEKFREIIEIQGGSKNIKPEDIEIGELTHDYCAYDDGYVKDISNLLINKIARTLGCPKFKGAGIKLFVKEGHKVSKGQPLMKLYAQKEENLTNALEIIEKNDPAIYIESMLLDRIGRE
ncbi:MAG: AMP phosphorylase [Candidatus Lokiarchaeota archaeon]|nr:AMP phosphorylase [Candidatus Lokiarchaeota archaeon]